MSKKLEEMNRQLEELESGDYTPASKSGKQKSPNEIRSEIRKYLASSGSTQTKFLQEIGVNSNSYGKFMQGAYKNAWSAVENGTYWAAARFLARLKLTTQIRELEVSEQQKVDKKAGKKAATSSSNSLLGKRDASAITATPTANAQPSSSAAAVIEIDQGTAELTTPSVPIAPIFVASTAKKSKDEVSALLAAISAVHVPEDCPVYANCDDVRRSIEHFLCTSGVNQSRFLAAIGAASNSLASFRKMKGKGA